MRKYNLNDSQQITQEDLYYFLNQQKMMPILERYYAEHNNQKMIDLEKKELEKMEKKIYKDLEKMLDEMFK